MVIFFDEVKKKNYIFSVNKNSNGKYFNYKDDWYDIS